MNIKGKTVLVTGVSGFIGGHLARRILSQGGRVKGIDRVAPEKELLSNRHFQFIEGDITDRKTVEECVRGVDLVINTAAIVKETGDFDLFRRVNVDAPVSLAKAAREGHTRAFLQFSSVMVYGFDYPAMVKETGPFGGNENPYCQTKIESELALMQCHRPGSFDVFIIRPGDVYGPGSIPWVVRPVQLMKKKQFFLVGGGWGTMNHVYIDNLLDAAFLVLEKNLSGRAFNVTDGAKTMFRDYFGQLAKSAGLKPPVSLPRILCEIITRVVSTAYRFVGLEPGVTPEALDFVTRPHPVSIEAIRAAGYTPKISLEDGLNRTALWLKSESFAVRTQAIRSATANSYNSAKFKWSRVVLAGLTALFAYLLLWPVPAIPVQWEAPKNEGYTGIHQENHGLQSLTEIPLLEGTGPEHLVVENGMLYAAVNSGAILRMQPDGKKQETWINTGGRPLGFVFDNDKNLIVADGIRGLLQISKSKQITVLTDTAGGEKINFADAIILSKNGVVYLSDASTRFGPEKWHGTFEASVLDVIEHSCTGRIITYDRKSRETKVISSGYCFANGLAFDSREESIFIAETGMFRILRLYIAGPKKGTQETVIENLPGYPDNLMRGKNGRIWVGLTKPRSKLVDSMSGSPLLRRITLRLPRFLWPVPKPYGHVIAFNESGKILLDLQDPTGRYPETTGVTETSDSLYVQSLHANTIGVIANKPATLR